MSNLSRRTVLTSAAGVAAVALPTVAAEAISPPPEPVFDAKALMAKLDAMDECAAWHLLDEVSGPLQERYEKAVLCRYLLQTVIDVLESVEPDDLLNTTHYRVHAAKRLRDAMEGRRPPIRIDYFDDDLNSAKPRFQAHPGWDEEDETLSDLVSPSEA